MREEDFWRLTLAQFNELARHYLDDLKLRDFHAAIICKVIADINRDKKKHPKPFKVEDFMPNREGRKRLTDDEMKKKLEMINIALGGERGE